MKFDKRERQLLIHKLSTQKPRRTVNGKAKTEQYTAQTPSAGRVRN
jgi:hypothetical protein